ncbi:MAG: metallophosphoesterase [Solirubrobacterales bacterium]
MPRPTFPARGFVLVLTAWTALSTVTTVPISSRPAVAEPPMNARARLTIAAAGDIVCQGDPGSDPSTCRYDDTADLVVGQGFTKILLLGDDQYETGAFRAFQTWFDPTWGRAFSRLAPSPGNHEYAQDPGSRPRGYFRYFGRDVKGPDGLGYYSFDIGACPDLPCWHVISLSSELCFATGGCDAPADPSNPGTGEQMYAWLQADLATHPNVDYPCTLAYWHHPLFSFSTGSGATQAVKPLWDLLYDAHAELVLNGHSHNYQRWKPQDPEGGLDRAGGIREFIVGTGGKSLYALESGPAPAHLVTAQDEAFGILKLTLGRAGYTWEWLGAAGQPAFTDTATRSAKCT